MADGEERGEEGRAQGWAGRGVFRGGWGAALLRDAVQHDAAARLDDDLLGEAE